MNYKIAKYTAPLFILQVCVVALLPVVMFFGRHIIGLPGVILLALFLIPSAVVVVRSVLERNNFVLVDDTGFTLFPRDDRKQSIGWSGIQKVAFQSIVYPSRGPLAVAYLALWFVPGQEVDVKSMGDFIKTKLDAQTFMGEGRTDLYIDCTTMKSKDAGFPEFIKKYTSLVSIKPLVKTNNQAEYEKMLAMFAK